MTKMAAAHQHQPLRVRVSRFQPRPGMGDSHSDSSSFKWGRLTDQMLLTRKSRHYTHFPFIWSTTYRDPNSILPYRMSEERRRPQSPGYQVAAFFVTDSD